MVTSDQTWDVRPFEAWIVDRSGTLSTAHNTGFAVGAINLLQRELRNGELPRSPLRVAQLVREPPDAERFAASLNWPTDRCAVACSFPESEDP
jgi:hypothetical protein